MEKDIGKIKKNDATEIIVRIDDFGGKKGLTIREYTTTEKYTGFTKSGTRIPADAFKDFRTLINSIDETDLEQEQQKPESNKQEKPKKSKKKESEEDKDDKDKEEEDEEDEEEDELF